MKNLFLLVAMMFAATLSRAQWQPDVRLTYDPSMSVNCYSNAQMMATSGDTLHIVWYDYRNGPSQIYYKRSTDRGLTWGPDTRLINTSANSQDPCVLVTGSIVHVAWSDDRNGSTNREIYYKRSEDGGSTWGTEARLTNAVRSSESPSLAISSDSILHMVWFDERNDPTGNWYTDIYYKRSTDRGLNWGPDTRLTYKTPPAYSGFPCVVVSGSVVHVAWEDQRNGSGDIYYKRSTDEGLTWGADTRLTTDPADQYDPCLAVSDSILHVVWHDNRNGSNNWEIYYKRSTDGGITWGEDTRLTNAGGTSELPTIAVSGSLVHVVWDDNRSNLYAIYYKQSTDGGLTWSSDYQLTNATGNSLWPFIVITDSVLHVLWVDDRDGNMEIYYKQNPTGNITVGIENDLINYAGKQISIWPNPASNIIHINFNNDSMEKTLLIIRNILGGELLSKDIRHSEAIMDVSNLQNGLYFVGIKTGNNQIDNTKLIIQK